MNIGIGYSFDVSVSDLFVPDLEGLGSKRKEEEVRMGWGVEGHGTVVNLRNGS